MTDTIYKNRGPTRLYYVFRVKRVVSMALSNCFRKVFYMYSLKFAFICYFFVAQKLIIEDPVIFQEVKMNLDIFFSCSLMSVITLNKFVLREHRLIFELCQYFI